MKYGQPYKLLAGKLEVMCRERASHKAGFDWARLKDLRHFFGSHLINSGVDSLIVARMIGHSDTAMITKRYGHLADDTIKKAVENFA